MPTTTPSATTPRLQAPAGATDCHMHILYPVVRHPVAEGETPFPEYSVDEYVAEIGRLGIERAVFAQTPRYKHDHTCVLAGVAELNKKLPGGARGTVCLPGSVSQDEIEQLHQQGIRGAAAHMLPGGCTTWDEIPEITAKISDFGWLFQVQLDGTTLPERRQALAELPVPVVIDHCGKFLQPGGLAHEGATVLLDLATVGNTYVKLSAPYESTWDDPPYLKDSGAIARALIEAAPDRCLWASNWPHLGTSGRAAWPDDAMLLDTLLAWTDSETARQKILVDNPARLYCF